MVKKFKKVTNLVLSSIVFSALVPFWACADILDRIEYKLERVRVETNLLANDVACINKELDGFPFAPSTTNDGNVYPIELATDPVFLSRVTSLSRLTPTLSPLGICNIEEFGGIWWRNDEGECWIAINPTNPDNMIVVTHQDISNVNSLLANMVLYTLDGGVTWNEADVVLSKSQGPTLPRSESNYDSSSDPNVIFDFDGNAYVFVVSFNKGLDKFQNTDEALVLIKSTNGGQSWTKPQVVTRDDGKANLLDRQMMWTDPYRDNLLYALWGDYVGSLGILTENFLKFSKSPDASTTWDPAIDVLAVDASNFNSPWGPILFVLPDVDNTLVVLVKSTDFNGVLNAPASFYVARSSDVGETWSSSVIFSDWTANAPIDPADGTFVRTLSFGIDAAFNPTNGNMYAVAQDAQFAPPGLGGSILTMSSDGGLTWSSPIPVNPSTLDAQAFLPTVAVADDGTVGVLFYDFRFYADGDASLKTDVWLALYTPDLSTRFDEIRLTPVSFDTRQFMRRPAFGQEAYFPGDYCKLQAEGNDFVACFIVTNPPYGVGPSPIPTDVFTIEDRNRQDIIFARVTRP